MPSAELRALSSARRVQDCWGPQARQRGELPQVPLAQPRWSGRWPALALHARARLRTGHPVVALYRGSSMKTR